MGAIMVSKSRIGFRKDNQDNNIIASSSMSGRIIIEWCAETGKCQVIRK